jgi:aspartyl-tRNA(Asn)/glutamyl-tRNA(Gln) amidotransferase subunit A
MDEWLTTSASDMGRAIGAGRIDPVALAEAFLERAAPRTDIYARLTAERARAEAQAARDRAREGRRRSLLDGVPISWKDLFDTAGTGTEAGSALLAGRVPARDAEVLRAATAAGLVCLGKTHMSELAFSGLGLNPVTGTPPNVNIPGAVPGGSSSGAAASVAFATAAAGIGSDTGGSVRIPAAWNDLVGLKTTSGLLSLEGVVPLCAKFDTVGPLTRSVEDAAQLLAAMGETAAPDLRAAPLAGLSFAVLETSVFEEIDDAPAEAFERTIRHLEAAGARMTRLSVPALAEVMPLSGILFTSEAYGTWKTEIEAAPEKMFPEILQRFRSGRDHLAADYVAAWQAIDRARAAWAEATAPFAAVLTPTAAILPPDKARLETEDAYYKHANLMTLRNTRVGNLMGLCGLTLPTGTPSCGLQVLGRPFAEAALLRVGAGIEAALR